MKRFFSLQGFNSQDTSLISAMVQLIESKLDAAWELSTHKSSDVTLVDIDAPNVQEIWGNEADNSLLVAYGHDNSVNARWFLPRPIRMQDLMRVFNGLATELTTGKKCPPPSENIASIASVAKMDKPTDVWAFNLQEYFVGLLKASLNAEQPICFSFGQALPLYFIPSERSCFTKEIKLDCPNATHKVLFSANAKQIDQHTVSYEEIDEAVKTQALTGYPVETILWLAATCVSHGRVNTSLAKQHFIRLKQWPNFSMLPQQSTYVSLAAFMLQQTADISMIASKTGIPTQQVTDFCNACEALDLLEYAETQKVRRVKAVSPQKRGLFQSILNRLAY